jgi:hypothetical protein
MALSGTTGGSIKVEGLRETIKQLEALGATKQEFVEINVEAARTVANAAESQVPVYDGTRNSKTGKRYYYKSGGDLKRSLRVSKAKGYAAVVMGNSKVQYANPIHWGWLYDKENFINKNIKPNPFLKRALDDNYQKVIRQYDKRIQALLDKYGVGN